MFRQKLLIIQNNSKHNCFHKAFFLFFSSDDYIILFLIFAKNENQFQIYSVFPSVFSSSSNDA